MSPFVHVVFLVTAVGVMTCAEAEEPFALPIIGGVTSPVNEFPFLVSLSIDGGSRWIHNCGGSIINESFILTAAHCTMSIERMRVVAGLYDLTKKDSGQWRTVSAFISHPRYVNATKGYDIAVVRLSSPLMLKAGEVEKATLNTDCACPSIEGPCTVTGWGQTAPEQGTGSDVRKKCDLKVVECRKQYKEANDGNVCAVSPTADACHCRGDSGGPLISRCGGRQTVVGVVSYGVANCPTDKSRVYTRVSFFQKWIATGDTSEFIGGVTSPVREFPFLVSLSTDGGIRWNSFCGGSIINESFILTAAHCCNGLLIGQIRVVAGLYNLTEKDTGQWRTVSDFIIHPRYNTSVAGPYDIAVIKLSSPLTLKAGEVEKATLNTDSACPSIGASSTVTGWGRTDSGSSGGSDVRKKCNLCVYSLEDCRKTLVNVTGINVTAGSVCAGTAAGGTSACYGDSGGPLISQCGGRDTVVGVVSCLDGRTCSSFPHQPGVYTRVSLFQKWIATGDLTENIPKVDDGKTRQIWIIVGTLVFASCAAVCVWLCLYKRRAIYGYRLGIIRY